MNSRKMAVLEAAAIELRHATGQRCVALACDVRSMAAVEVRSSANIILCCPLCLCMSSMLGTAYHVYFGLFFFFTHRFIVFSF